MTTAQTEHQKKIFEGLGEATHPYKVSDFVREVKNHLEGKYQTTIWIEGETTNLSMPKSGHWYFSLKDKDAQIRCVMFAGRNKQVKFDPESGLKVMALCRVGLYEPRGDLQVIVTDLRLIDEGAFRLAFEQLYKKLEQEGLFEIERKRQPPNFPQHIGIIASESGATVHDVLTVLNRRSHQSRISLIPSATQGNQAPTELIKALTLAQEFNQDSENENKKIDVLLMIRGGGEAESLQAYNDEKLARAVAKCPIPIISGIGHETDTSIVDFVADIRAATPSAAAEIVSRNDEEDLKICVNYRQLLYEVISRQLKQFLSQVSHYQQRLRDPGRQIETWQQRLDDLIIRQKTATQLQFNSKRSRLDQVVLRLSSATPNHLLETIEIRLNNLRPSLHKKMQHRLQQSGRSLQLNVVKLAALSPLNTLIRGYAIAYQEPSAITSVRQVLPGDTMDVFLQDGRINCQILSIQQDDDLLKDKDR